MATGRNPVFVVGNSRSGTTMLRLMLTCHPSICIPPEGPFATLLLKHFSDVREWNESTCRDFSSRCLSIPKLENWGITSVELEGALTSAQIRNYGEAVTAVYELYSRKHDPAAVRWGDKSGTVPLKSLFELSETFLKCHFVHIVRDGRDVLCSYRGTKGIDSTHAPNLPHQAAAVAREWSRRVADIDMMLESVPSERKTSVRYEDLVQHPVRELTRICTALGEEYVDSMLDFGKRNQSSTLEPVEFLQWKRKTVEPVSPSQVSRWKNELDINEVAMFEYVAGAILSRYGYEVSSGKLNWFDRVNYISTRACRRFFERLGVLKRRAVRKWR